MRDLSLEIADEIVNATLSKGRELGTQPLTVAILDRGGHPIVLKRADDSGILRVDIAIGKAWGCLGMGYSSRALGARAQQNPLFFSAISAASSGKTFPVAGGVLIRESGGGAVLAAIGVSGDTSDRDEECAVFGIETNGLFADIEVR